MKIKSIKETCLYHTRLDEMVHFYGTVMGLPVIASTDTHCFFRAGSSVLLIFDPEESKLQEGLPGHAAEGSVHFALLLEHPEDYPLWKQRLQDHGVKIEREKIWPNGKSCYFRDPANHLVEILERDIWAGLE